MADRRVRANSDWVDRQEAAAVDIPVADLLASPNGPRDRQLLLGDDVTILGQRDGHVYIRAPKDGYHGFLTQSSVTRQSTATHKVASPASHAYEDPDIKSRETLSLSFGSRITATGETDDFIVTSQGYIPKVHLKHCDDLESDPVSVATLFIGTPYLWGGNSRWGIDCSGLVQTALLACGQACPGDSDLQLDAFGSGMPAETPLKRGDLLFWQGHVALARDDTVILHANAFHMMTTFEDAKVARDRIGRSNPFLAHIRL